VISKGCGITDGTDEDIKAAVEAAKVADIVILALGEHYDMTGESASRAFIKLPGRQEELASEILRLGKKTAVVLFNGRPLEITELYAKAPAILEAWYPGTEGGNAAADILFGDKTPTARLSMSFPYTVGQLPIYYNSFNTGRPKPSDESNNYKYSSQYDDVPNSPLLPFGFGLSYTAFEYGDFKLGTEVLTENSSITASVKVKNIGGAFGEETVQLYIRDISGSVIRPMKELKAFKKISLASGEEQEVTFKISEEMLRFYNSKYEFKSEKGKFTAMVGPNSRDLQGLNFELK
jgi:beta-glucosidase